MSETKEAFKRSLKGALSHAKRVLKTNNELRRGLIGAGIGATTTGAASYAGAKAIRNSESFKKKPKELQKRLIKRQRIGILGATLSGAVTGGSIGADSGNLKDHTRKLTKLRRKYRADDFRYRKWRSNQEAKWKADSENSKKYWDDFAKEWADNSRKTREAYENYHKSRGSRGSTSSGSGGYAPPPKPPQNVQTPNWLKDVKTKADAKKRYREQAAKNHPDRGGNTKDMQDINLAWEAFKKSSDFDKLGMRLPSFFQELLQIRSRP